MILIRLEKQLSLHNYFSEIRLKYTSNEGEKIVKNYPITYDYFATQKEYCSDSTIKNGICLNYYVKYCRKLMKAENSISKKKSIDLNIVKEEFKKTMNQSTEKVKEFLNSNLFEFYSTDKKDNYLKKIDFLLTKSRENENMEIKNEGMPAIQH